MPARLHQYCREDGCGERTNHRNGWCDKHQGDNTFLRNRAAKGLISKRNDPIWKLYGAAWRKFSEAFFGNGNGQCQRLVDGKRCNRAVEILHHIISPRENAGLMYTPTNVVGVCRQHHPPSQGEPKENLMRLDEIYVPTLWIQIRF